MNINEYFQDDKERPGFNAWGKALDKLCTDEIGLDLLSLPDQNYADMYADGLTPEEAWEDIKENEGYSETETDF